MASQTAGGDLGSEATMFEAADKHRGSMDSIDDKHVAPDLFSLWLALAARQICRQALL